MIPATAVAPVRSKPWQRMTLEERFWQQTDRRGDDDCWPWRKAEQRGVYGRIRDRGVTRKASQVSWEIFHSRPFPPGKIACHSCDRPWCVNPHHILPGTLSENQLDAVAKGRQSPPRGPNFNALKDTCKRGHPLVPQKAHPNRRYCLTCKREAHRQYKRSKATRPNTRAKAPARGSSATPSDITRDGS